MRSGSSMVSASGFGLRRAFIAALSLVFVAGLAPVAGAADTSSQISVQEKRLKWLEERARQKQGRVAALQKSVRALTAQIRQSNATLDDLDRRRRRHEDQLIDAMAAHDRLRARMATVSAEMYMRGPAEIMLAVMDARTLSDAGDAVNFSGAVVSSNRRVAERTALAAQQISELHEQNEAMIARHAATLRRQKQQQDELVDAFAESQHELEEIMAIREEVVELLVSLRRQFDAERLATLGGTMPYGAWAERWLGYIDAPTVRGNMVAMIAWQLAEGTTARWNPLATTWRMPGSTQFNGHRVQNYVSLEQGLEATRKTLSRPNLGYEPILSNLRAGAAAMDTARAINASRWCRGCADGQYVIELIPVVERYYDKYANRRARPRG